MRKSYILAAATERSLGEMSEFLLQLRWTGRFGNRLFQFAYGATYARLTGLEFWLPADWEGTRLFKHQPHKVVQNDEIRLALRLPDEGAASNQKRMEAVRKYYADAELIDTEIAPEPVPCSRSPSVPRERMHLQSGDLRAHVPKASAELVRVQ